MMNADLVTAFAETGVLAVGLAVYLGEVSEGSGQTCQLALAGVAVGVPMLMTLYDNAVTLVETVASATALAWRRRVRKRLQREYMVKLMRSTAKEAKVQRTKRTLFPSFRSGRSAQRVDFDQLPGDRSTAPGRARASA